MKETLRDTRATVGLVRHWRLSSDPDHVTRVRQDLRQQCADWRIDHRVADDVVLVASELLSNAVRHARGPLLLTVQAGATHIYVGVLDRAPDTPVQRKDPPLESDSGRGLALVETLSTGWGSEPQTASSKLVWATLPTGNEASATASPNR